MAVASSPEVLSVLAHDLRWTIVGLLVPGDLRSSELVSRTGQAPSLVSYHLARLRDAGLVSARRSAADGRDSYHALDLDALGQAVADMAGQITAAKESELRRKTEPAPVSVRWKAATMSPPNAGPTARASARICPSSVGSGGVAGMTGTPASCARLRASTLLPRRRMVSGSGPTTGTRAGSTT